MSKVLIICLLKFLLPATLITCCLIRQCLLSLLYGLLFLVWPFSSSYSATGDLRKNTKTYLKSCVILGSLALTSQLIVCGLSFGLWIDGHPSDCDKFWTLLRAIGLQRHSKLSLIEIVRYIAPDVAVTFVSIVTLLVYVCSKPRHAVLNQLDEVMASAVLLGLGPAIAQKQKALAERYRRHFSKLHLSELTSLTLLALCGAIYPCLLSAVYFIAFLAIITYWSMYLPIGRRTLNVLKVVVSFYCAVHSTLLYVSQMELFQKVFDLSSISFKLIGLPVVFNSTCANDTLMAPIMLNPFDHWPIYLNAAVLLMYFIYTGLQYNYEQLEDPHPDDMAEVDPFLAVSDRSLPGPSTLAADRSGLIDETSCSASDRCFKKTDIVTHSNYSKRLFSFEHLFDRASSAKRDVSYSTTKFNSYGGKFLDQMESIEFHHSALSKFFGFVIRHSYVLSLIMMMAWAIMYHCWLSFVWLAMACFIWLTSDSRATCLKLSPFIVIYTEILLCCEFLYGIRSHIAPLIQDIWPEESPSAPLLQIGFITPQGPACIPLLAKLFFSVPFWILLRVFLREKQLHLNNQERGMSPTFSLYHSQECTDRSRVGLTWFGQILATYWIYVVGLTLLLISLRQPVVVYAILYMLFFLVLITVFQVSFRIWRLMLLSFWSLLVVYSIMILLVVYTYQFHDVPMIWRNWTGWEITNSSHFQFKDFGLVEYDSGDLFIQLLTPISFLVVVILQLKFFHHDFMIITDLRHQTNEEDDVKDIQETAQSFSKNFLANAKNVAEVLWKAAEIHVAKIVAFALIMVAICDVCVVNFLFVIVACLMLMFTKLHYFLSIFSNLWASAIIITRMLFQMNFISGSTLSVNVHGNCSISFNQEWNNIDPAKWSGFEKSDNVALYLKNCLIICCLLTFQSIVRIRRHSAAKQKGFVYPTDKDDFNILFPKVKRINADESIKKCCQFLANYWFRQFGLETCYTMIVITVGARMDAAALVYCIWLLVLLCLPRYVLMKIWRVFVIFVGTFIAFQYVLCVGLPPSHCTKLLWTSAISSDGDRLANPMNNRTSTDPNRYDESSLWTWFYLPSYDRNRQPNVYFLFADFFILLCASCQLRAFVTKTSTDDVSDFDIKVYYTVNSPPRERESRPLTTPPAENDSFFPSNGDSINKPTIEMYRNNVADRSNQPRCSIGNPVPNFIVYTKSYLDMCKICIFAYCHWFTLVVVFAAGFGRVSLFAVGYLIAAFCLLWKGNDLYLEPLRLVEMRWYSLLIYNVLSILLKVVLQIVGCGYIHNLCETRPVIIRLFSIACLGSKTNQYPFGSECYVPPEEPEIFYDGICFGFLMLQMQIFHSWYFKHSIAWFKAQRILSARGAVVISELMKNELKQQQDIERKALERLIKKTALIRDQYLRKQSGKKSHNYTLYGDDNNSVEGNKLDAKIECNNYWNAKRSGDYYMFEYETDSDDEVENERNSDVAPADEKSQDEKIALGPLQLAHMVISKDFDIAQTVEECKEKMRQMTSVDNVQLAAMASSGDELSIGGFPSLRRSTTTRAIENPIEITFDHVSKYRGDEEREEANPALTPTPSYAPRRKSTYKSKTLASFTFLQMFASSILEWLLRSFNKLSRDCRYVACVLKNENKLLMETLVHELEGESTIRSVQEKISTKEIGRRIRKAPTAADIEKVENQVKDFEMQHNVVIRFLIALYYLLFSRTDLLCYLMMILAHMNNAALISLPLPLFAFFWGTLCSPRPPKFFWITVITYTQAMIGIKFIFQFDILPSRYSLNDPLHRIVIIGLEKSNNYVAWDVALLMVLFFHRYVLKVLGLWKDVDPNDLCPNSHSDLNTSDQHSRYSISHSNVENHRLCTFGSHSELNSSLYRRNTEKATLSDIKEHGDKEDDVYDIDASADTNKMRFRYLFGIINFYRRLFRPEYQYVTDMYSLMFVCDCICFLILAFGYSSFGVAAAQGDVVSDLKSNKVPLPFVSVLMVLMILIIVDRGIYLRKSVASKLLFQYTLVIGVHGWIFFGLPAITDIHVHNNTSAQLWYFVKCIYFLLSAWQIKNGYRSRRYGNALTKHYNLLNYCCFTGFMAAPFLFELRTLVDWIWTQTGMPLFDYFSMENIYAAVYRLKCMRKMEKDYPMIRGEPQGPVVKYGIGFPILIFIIVLLWLPLLLFALVNSIGRGLLPISARFTISIKGYPPLYEAISEDFPSLATLSSAEYSAMREKFDDKRSLMFLRDYSMSSTQKVVFDQESDIAWTISHPSRRKLLHNLKNSTADMSLIFKWQFTRPRESSDKEPATQSSSTTILLKPRSPIRDQLVKLLDATMDDSNHFSDSGHQSVGDFEENEPTSFGVVQIDRAFPAFVELPSYGQVEPVRPMLQNEHNFHAVVKNGDNNQEENRTQTTKNVNSNNYYDFLPVEEGFTSLQLELRSTSRTFRTCDYKTSKTCTSYRSAGSDYWVAVVVEQTGQKIATKNIEMVIFVDKVFPSALDVFTSKGIIGVYVVVVLAAGRFMRSLVVTSPLEIMITEMPNVDKILQLCLDIYLVREARDFFLELDLFAKLIFLIRSPETLIKWTRPKLK